MKLNNKGYTLVELLATMLILGILMLVSIPNIVGISIQSKKSSYAEDAKKMKTNVEYMIRGGTGPVEDSGKPTAEGDCVVVALNLIHGSDFDSAPNGGKYLMNNSFVVMVKRDHQYKYYVQLVEDLDPDRAVGVPTDYVGYTLVEYSNLEGNKYLDSDKYLEKNSLGGSGGFVNVSVDHELTSGDIPSTVGCTNLKKTYYAT